MQTQSTVVCMFTIICPTLEGRNSGFAMRTSRSNGLRAFLVILFVFIEHGDTEICQMLDQCSCKKSSGKIISLWEIDGGSKGPAFKDFPTISPPGAPYIFYWNPCTKFTKGDGCTDVLMCQKLSGSSVTTHPCADSVEEFKVDNDGTTAIIYNKYTDKDGYERTVTINLKCDENKYPGDIDGVTENQQGQKVSTYSTTLTSRCACDDGCPHPNKPVTGGGGLSAGSILLIVFFAFLFVYLIGGILINKYKLGVESMPEMCPNYKFWAEIPSLIKDGCIFTFQGIAGCCKSLSMKVKGDSYAEI